MSNIFLGISIEEWFTYHPIMTDERKLKHEVVNVISLQAAKCIGADHPNAEKDFVRLCIDLIDKIEQPELKDWATQKIAFQKDDSLFDQMMKLQQLRMVANQSITVAELHGARQV